MSDAVMVHQERLDRMLDAMEADCGRMPVHTVRSIVKDLLTAASTPVGGWQDISTAPKDGTKFDAWDRDGRITDVYWSDIQDAFCTDGQYGPEEPSPVAFVPALTHWRSLPAAPPPLVSTDKGSRPQEAVPTAEDEGAAVVDEARRLYTSSTDSDTVHCNRFPSWGELYPSSRSEWIVKAQTALAAPQPADGCSSNEGAV